MKKKGGSGAVVFVIIILVVAVLGWGFVGGQEAKKIGVTCDMGVGETFCWKWHTNTLGQIQEVASNTGNAIRDFFE